jgi:alcohol dehydrogenase (cytochrome c)
MRSTSVAEEPSLNDLYALSNRDQFAPGTELLGHIEAISVETGATIWVHEQRAGVTSLLSTGSGLLFGGDVNGRFRAYDQLNGEILWEVNLGSHVTGFPATFAVDGRQYVAVSTGGSGLALGLAALAGITPGSGNRLYVFALPD